MPEGPEVRIIAEGLTKHLANKNIINIEINAKSRYHKKAPDGFTEFIAAGFPCQVVRVNSHGKFIWWEFNNGWHAWQTLGLAGGWFLKEKGNSGIIITLDGGKKLYYDDARHFGTLKFIPPAIAQAETRKKLKTLGPDILAGGVNPDILASTGFISRAEFVARLNKYPAHLVINIIAEQKVIAGVGNYLRSEILYKSRINPHKKVSSLSQDEFTRLYENTLELTIASYKAGGASIQHYSDVNSQPGQFEFQMQVYGRKKTPDGNHTVKAEKIGKDTQTTYWCPDVQV